ncbi:hypothetical protein POM88_003599 [Heracleum sosnowskyi]|uniref:Uncharacterized protein n=1 Tax=Heracleum sosnowskyi TaxID=360622 RepID=A0AAD8JIC0_9APIA|nr:hypothetical protein POM88_003599 [Heracleum sosnowskyi]
MEDYIVGLIIGGGCLAILIVIITLLSICVRISDGIKKRTTTGSRAVRGRAMDGNMFILGTIAATQVNSRAGCGGGGGGHNVLTTAIYLSSIAKTFPDHPHISDLNTS